MNQPCLLIYLCLVNFCVSPVPQSIAKMFFTPTDVTKSGFPHNSPTIPSHEFQFPNDIEARNFINCARNAHQNQTLKLLHDWNVKFPEVSLTIWQNFIFPWQIIKFNDNSSHTDHTDSSHLFSFLFIGWQFNSPPTHLLTLQRHFLPPLWHAWKL